MREFESGRAVVPSGRQSVLPARAQGGGLSHERRNGKLGEKAGCLSPKPLRPKGSIGKEKVYSSDSPEGTALLSGGAAVSGAERKINLSIGRADQFLSRIELRREGREEVGSFSSVKGMCAGLLPGGAAIFEKPEKNLKGRGKNLSSSEGKSYPEVDISFLFLGKSIGNPLAV